MADPISLVGTAVGVISLGIQVCQGLYNYVDSVRGRDKDLDAASLEIQYLIGVFQSLESLIPRLEALPNLDAKTINTFQSCINQSDQGLKDLQRLFASLQDSPQQDVKGKLKNAGRALTFGLHRASLSKMQERVKSIVATTELALQIINSQLGMSHNAELARLNAALQPHLSAASQSLSHLEQRADESGARLQSMEGRIETISVDMMATVDTTSRDIKSANIELASQNQANFQSLQILLATQHQQTQSQLMAMQNAHTRELSRLHLRLIEQPAALREVCDVLSNKHERTPTRRHSQRPTLLPSVCSCGMRNRDIKSVDSALQVGTFHAYAQQLEESRHLKDCAFYLPQKRTSIGLRFELSLRQIASHLIDLSLSYTTGAGGFSISPKLNAVRVVMYSPAFKLIDDLCLTSWSPEKYHERAIVTGNQILSLFRNGQASPHDRNIYGNNILNHLAFSCSAGWDNPTASVQDKTNFHILQLFRTLISAGVSASETGQFGRTLLDELGSLFLPENSFTTPTSIQALAVEISPLIERELFDDPARSVTRLVMNNPAFIRELDLTQITRAILLKSETDVRTIIATCPHAVFEKFSTFTVLHLSSNWPIGLSILLSAGASTFIDEKSENNQTALDLALYFRSAEAVQILLNYGSMWDPSQVPWPDGTSFECSRRLAGSLAERRRSLYSIAKRTLTVDELGKLRILDGNFPDSEICSIIQKLERKGVQVPKLLTVPEDYEGVYLSGRQGEFDISHFPAFLESGFSNMNETNSQGLLPITIASVGNYLKYGVGDMRMSFVSPNILSWLVQHSCLNQSVMDPLVLGFNTSATGFHFLTLRLIKESDFQCLEERVEFTVWLNNFSRQVFEAPSKDTCNCWCSSSGCSPFNTYLKALIDYTDQSAFLQSENFSLDPEYSFMSWDTPVRLSTEFLRFLTFEALEMTHTCCSIEYISIHNTRRFCWMLMRFPGDVEEIQDEEKELGERLETLTEHFQYRLAETQEPLCDFIWGYWREKMANECVPSFEESDGVTRVGVRVDKTYKTPMALRKILGSWFNFLSSDEESDAEQSESESEGSGS